MTSHSMTFRTRGAAEMGEKIAVAVVFVARQLMKPLQALTKLIEPTKPLDSVRTPEDLLEHAARIEKREPGFAADLRAAAHRAMNSQD